MLKRLHPNEKGIALASVVIVAVVMMGLVASTVALAVNSQDLSKHDQDWNAALAAAEAGIDDYMYRLNRVDAYWQYPKTGFPNGPDNNTAFTEWTPIPGPSNDGEFRYAIDSSTLPTDGAVKIASTGRVGSTTRTVFATLRRRNFLDYLYFTDFETMDPALYEAPYNNGHDQLWGQTNCARHYYDTPARHSECVIIHFQGTGSDPSKWDEIRGPMHSNDAYYTAGRPRFLGDTSTSWNPPSPPRYIRNTSYSGSPFFQVSGDPRYLPTLRMPPNNLAIKTYTDPAIGETGCLYTGPTRIILNSNGTMSVISPLTKVSNTGCGSFPSSSTQTVPIPPNGVVYVQGVPADPSDPNYSNCTAISNYPLKTPAGIPINNDITPYTQGPPKPYGNCAGDAFVRGTLKGHLTIGTANNIIVIDDLTYSDSGPDGDLLGLVALNFVEVYHPVNCTDFNTYDPPGPNNSYQYCADGNDLLSTTLDNLRINAAILSVRHSFRVQNYRFGSQNGDLTVNGVIAQTYRGIVGLIGSTGYVKDYNYDQRLSYQSPPHFLDPVESAWSIATWAENKPCYPDANGDIDVSRNRLTDGDEWEYCAPGI